MFKIPKFRNGFSSWILEFKKLFCKDSLLMYRYIVLIFIEVYAPLPSCCPSRGMTMVTRRILSGPLWFPSSCSSPVSVIPSVSLFKLFEIFSTCVCKPCSAVWKISWQVFNRCCLGQIFVDYNVLQPKLQCTFQGYILINDRKSYPFCQF